MKSVYFVGISFCLVILSHFSCLLLGQPPQDQNNQQQQQRIPSNAEIPGGRPGSGSSSRSNSATTGTNNRNFMSRLRQALRFSVEGKKSASAPSLDENDENGANGGDDNIVIVRGSSRSNAASASASNSNVQRERAKISVSVACLAKDIPLKTLTRSKSNSGQSQKLQGTTSPTSGVFGISLQRSVTEIPRAEPFTREANCGDDAYFISKTLDYTCVGVADGVGGWHKRGVDPSNFSWKLMSACKRLSNEFSMNHPACPRIPHPIYDLMEPAYEEALKSARHNAGSSTVCIGCIDTSEKGRVVMNVAALGDSALFVIRNQSIVFKTKETQHQFNSPYQLTVLPSTIKYRLFPSFLQGGGRNDSPRDSSQDMVNLSSGDIIIACTDGLLDNVPLDDVVKESNRIFKLMTESSSSNVAVNSNNGTDQKQQPQLLNYDLFTSRLSSGLVNMAYNAARDEFIDSPFALKARKNGYSYMGGKEDDITVIAVYIQ